MRISSFKESSQVSRNADFSVELVPGDPHHPPAIGNEETVAFAIRLEGSPCLVRRAPIQLDDQFRSVPEAIDDEEPAARREVGIEAGT
jgi:hypothetical protein